MKKYLERLWNGLVKENPVLVLMLGMCPALAVSTEAMNGIGMGLSTLAVLVFSNLIISLLRKAIPDQVRLPAYIVIVASLGASPNYPRVRWRLLAGLKQWLQRWTSWALVTVPTPVLARQSAPKALPSTTLLASTGSI